MEIVGEQEADGRVSSSPPSEADAEVEDRERQARELKAGLHPLRVGGSLSPLRAVSLHRMGG